MRINQYEKKYIYSLGGLNIYDKILLRLFTNYSFKLYSKGYRDGFNFFKGNTK